MTAIQGLVTTNNNLKMEIRKLPVSFCDEVMMLIRKAISEMKSKEIEQWDHIYPDWKTIHNDLDSGTMYAAVENEIIVGVVAVNEEQDPSYSSVSWSVNAGKVLVVHRLCIDPDQQGKGIAKALMRFVEQFALENKYGSIRLDAFSLNPAANKLYKNLNYSFRGTVYLRKGEFYLYEKEIILTER